MKIFLQFRRLLCFMLSVSIAACLFSCEKTPSGSDPVTGEITEEITAQYVENTKDVFSAYQEISDQISHGRAEYAQLVARNDKISSELSCIQSELTEIQKGIFLGT